MIVYLALNSGANLIPWSRPSEVNEGKGRSEALFSDERGIAERNGESRREGRLDRIGNHVACTAFLIPGV